MHACHGKSKRLLCDEEQKIAELIEQRDFFRKMGEGNNWKSQAAEKWYLDSNGMTLYISEMGGRFFQNFTPPEQKAVDIGFPITSRFRFAA